MRTITNQKLDQLLKYLDEAEQLAGQFSGGYSNNFLSAEEFHTTLLKSISKLKEGDYDQLNHLNLWFGPTCDWDDFVSVDGATLANNIFQLTTELIKSLDIYSIFDLIKDYQQNVERVMEAFKKEFDRTDLLYAWKVDKILPQVGHLRKYKIKHYAFHGIGLAVIFDDNTSIDFDFAFLPEQRHDGFDIWRLSQFASARPDKYKKYLNKQKLEADFNAQVERRTIVKPITNPSTDLYFFQSALSKSKPKIGKAWWKFW